METTLLKVFKNCVDVVFRDMIYLLVVSSVMLMIGLHASKSIFQSK